MWSFTGDWDFCKSPQSPCGSSVVTVTFARAPRVHLVHYCWLGLLQESSESFWFPQEHVRQSMYVDPTLWWQDIHPRLKGFAFLVTQSMWFTLNNLCSGIPVRILRQLSELAKIDINGTKVVFEFSCSSWIVILNFHVLQWVHGFIFLSTAAFFPHFSSIVLGWGSLVLTILLKELAGFFSPFSHIRVVIDFKISIIVHWSS